MNSKNIYTLLVTVACGVTLTVHAQNTLISGDIAVGGNWDAGLPTDDLNPGVIDGANIGGNAGTFSGTATGLAIDQTGGELSFTGFGTSVFDDVNYNISNGTFTSTSFGHRSQNNSIFEVSGGTVNVVGFGLESTSTLNLSSGSINATGNITSKASVLNLSGGSMIVGGNVLGTFNTGTFNFSGDTDLDITGQFGAVHFATSSTLNVGVGTGSITTGALEADSMSIDWTSGTGFTFDATTILNGGAAATWEDLWNAGQLTLDGSNTGTFSENFQVSGGTLSLATIPEPSSIALVGLAGLVLLAVRRRR